MDRLLEEILPAGQEEGRLRQFIWDSYELLDSQPYNRRRREEGLAPANLLWPWGQGRAPRMTPFSVKRGMTGAVIAGVDVIRGLGRLTGLEVVNVPGATGYFDTDYSAKAAHALAALKRHPFAWIHVEAPDEAGHLGSIDEKIKAIEAIDERIVGPVVEGLRKLDQCRILVVPDHATPVSTRGHKGVPVPYLLFDSERTRSSATPYDERAAHERVPRIDEGYRLIDELLKS
jgi:2,3-bisphosphoglycerate-independent phosphoglycerate mutase